MYQARARVQVDTETYSPALGASRGNSYYIDNSYMDPEYFNTQVQILSSPTLLRRVAKTLDLEHNSNFLDARSGESFYVAKSVADVGLVQQTHRTGKDPNVAVLKKVDHVASIADFSQRTIRPRLRGWLLTSTPWPGMIQVEQVKKTRLIDIRATHTDPAVATKVVNATADAFGLWNLEVKTKTNTVAGTYMQKRIAELAVSNSQWRRTIDELRAEPRNSFA